MEEHQRVILVILDGWGYAPAWGGNAVEMADTPNFDRYWRKFPKAIVNASQEAVGLPRHEPGNSEVGHLNIGSGKVVKQNLLGISEEINKGIFFQNQVLLSAVKNAQDLGGNIHLIGLVSDGGIHSHIYHLFALLDFLKQRDFKRVFIHMITDGRDTDPMKALSYMAELEEVIKKLGFGKIASVMGRFYAMDRDNHWERIQKVYDLLTLGIAPKADTPKKAIANSYRQGNYDEFIIPAIIENNEKFVALNDKDSVIFFNFRSDRTRELTKAFVQKDFKDFKRKVILNNLFFATFAFHEEYEEHLPVKVVFAETKVETPIAKVLSEAGIRQYHTAETEKFAHVTYFFDGGKNFELAGEKYQLIPSPRVPTYDLKPEMSAEKVTEVLLQNLKNFNFTVINYANPDMVGHTGNLKATVKACEFVDICLGKVVEAALANKMTAIVTADHGNAEQMINPNTGQPHTEHTTNPVPFILISENQDLHKKLRVTGGDYGLALSDIAPTILKIMNLSVPKEMTGKSLLE